MGLYRSDRDADRDTETETRQEGAEWNKEAQEMGKGQWPAGCPVRPLLSPICILSPCHSSEGHSMPTGCFLVPRPSDRQEGGIKREQVEKRGWRETGLGRPLPASPATPGPCPAAIRQLELRRAKPILGLGFLGMKGMGTRCQ